MSTTNLLSQRRRNYISSEDCIRVKTLRKHTDKTIPQIAQDLGLSWHQVQHACARHSESPSVRTGRPPVLSSQQTDRLVAFVRSSYEARRMSYLDLSLDPFREWNVGQRCIQRALNSRGYSRRRARSKSVLSDLNKTKRIEFAQTHINWSLDDWSRVLWTDETWATGNPHKNTWVTRLVDEQVEDFCVDIRSLKGNGWMFWGSFMGSQKGPHVIWDKRWGKINQASFSERVVPSIINYHREHPGLILMQDSAPAHRGRVLDELAGAGIELMEWPPFSPDLNPIENVWNIMKEKMQFYFPELNGQRLPDSRIRAIVQASWDLITNEHLTPLLASMHSRCQAVLDANGGHTRF